MSIEWRTQERHSGDKSPEWYLAVVIITVAVIITSVIFDNVLLAILIGVGFIALILTHKKKKNIIEVSVTSKGLRVSDYLYIYENLESFDIDTDRWVLIIKSKKFFSPHIIIPMGEDVSVDVLEKLLKEHLDHEEMRESILEQFVEYLGF